MSLRIKTCSDWCFRFVVYCSAADSFVYIVIFLNSIVCSHRPNIILVANPVILVIHAGHPGQCVAAYEKADRLIWSRQV